MDRRAVRLARLLTNRAACALKLRDWPGAINDCTAALSMSERARTAFIDAARASMTDSAARAAPKTTPSLSSSDASTGARGTLVR